MSTRIKRIAAVAVLAAAPAAVGTAGDDERVGRSGTVDAFDADEGIVVIASERYRMGGARVAPPPWDDTVTARPEPEDVFSAGAQVRFTVREDSEYPPVIERIWLAR